MKRKALIGVLCVVLAGCGARTPEQREAAAVRRAKIAATAGVLALQLAGNFASIAATTWLNDQLGGLGK